jgi:hypothetical protein
MINNMYIGVHVTYPLFLSDFNFSTDFRKNRHISNLMEIRPVGAELCTPDVWAGRWTDVRTDMTKLVVALRSFATAPKHGTVWNT